MSEREEHKELIHQLAERLRNHTEPYKDGAWERFAASYGKHRRTLWPYWSAAAALLLAATGLYWSTRHSAEIQAPLPQMVQHELVPQSVEPFGNGGDLPVGAVPTPSTSEDTIGSAVRLAYDGDSGMDRPEGIQHDVASAPAVFAEETSATDAVAEADSASMLAAEPQRLAAVAGSEEKVDGLEQPIDGIRSDPAFNGGDVHPETYAGTPQKSGGGMEKWDVGVMVAPSLTSEKVNLGGGLTVAYQISDKLSIGSGISVAQLGVGENPNYRPGHSSRQSDYLASPTESPGGYPLFNGKSESALGYKREVSLTSSVVTLDIPLDLRYEVAKGFYTAIGVSYVAVLNEQRTGHYIDKINTNTFLNGHGSADRLAATEFVYSSEEIPAKPLRGNGYAGFMNFSIGKKLPISQKLFLSVEPYFKLPIGRLSREEMNFTNGGIRIVTGF